MSPVQLVMFVKAPVAGFAKTRLIPALGALGAAELAQRLFAHALHEALKSRVGVVEGCFTPAVTEAVWQTLPVPNHICITDQGDGDLGERMARAAARVIAAGHAVLLMGTDCPQLDAPMLQRAAAALNDADAVLIPAADGGYVLLGLKAFDASVFTGIAWSTDSVAADTLARLKRLNWQTKILPTLHDIDEPADLKWLPPAIAASFVLLIPAQPQA